MADPLSLVTQTKVIIPRCRVELLSRSRLLDKITDRLDNKLLTVTAPAGYGKTSLLIDMAHHTSLPVCWFALDALDNDPHRFINHFLAAIAERFPGVAPSSMQLLDDSNISLKAIVGAVINTIYRHVHEYFVLVLDDFHVITTPEIIEFVDLFVQFVDENCRLVISSRRLVNLPNVLLLVGRADVAGLGPSDLAFQAAEIQALFLQNYNCAISPEAAAQLAHETEGWITGLLLSTQPILSQVVDRLHQAQISGQRVYDYLANQVFEQQPASVQDFLLRTAWFDEFNAELMQAIFGPVQYPDGHTWYTLTHQIVAHNLFVLPIDDRLTWFRYHQLFREFLQNRLVQQNPTIVTHIFQQVAQFYFDNAERDKAQSFYLRLGDVTAVANLIERAGLQLVRGLWLNTLPPAMRGSRPMLLALDGYTQIMLGRVKHALLLLNQAEREFAAANYDPVGLVRTLGWRAGAQRLLGQYQAALADANRGLLLAQTTNSLYLRATALKAWGQCLLTVRRSQEGVAALEESLALFKALGDEENVARLNLETGVAYLTLGRYETAGCYFELAQQHFNKTGNATRLADLFCNWGVLHHLTGNFQLALQQLKQGLDFARQSDYVRMQAYALCGLGDIYMDLDMFDAAGSAYLQAQQVALHTDETFLLIYLELTKCSIARQRGDFALAHSVLDFASHKLNEGSSNYERGLYWLEAGLVAMAENNPSSAATHFECALNNFDDQGQRVEKSRTHLYLAAVSHTNKQPKAALQHLQIALKLVSALENGQPLVATGRNLQPLLAFARRRTRSMPNLSQFLDQVETFKSAAADYRRTLRRQLSEVPCASPKLAIRVLGQPWFSLNNEVVGVTEWANRQTREFFYYLLARPNGATKEAIGCDLWPECTSHELKVRFKNCIYRLRRVIGDECITYDQIYDQYAFNRAFDYEYDAELFEWLLNQVRHNSTVQAKIGTLQQAVRLYRGPYLADIDAVWVLAERQRLHYLYVQALLKLAELHFETKTYDLALEASRQLIRDDPGQEIAYRLTMRIHAALGDRCAVVRQFKACEAALQEEVSAPVSAETRDLLAELLH